MDSCRSHTFLGVSTVHSIIIIIIIIFVIIIISTASGTKSQANDFDSDKIAIFGHKVKKGQEQILLGENSLGVIFWAQISSKFQTCANQESSDKGDFALFKSIH